jgi:hypothetical protein
VKVVAVPVTLPLPLPTRNVSCVLHVPHSIRLPACAEAGKAEPSVLVVGLVQVIVAVSANAAQETSSKNNKRFMGFS